MKKILLLLTLVLLASGSYASEDGEGFKYFPWVTKGNWEEHGDFEGYAGVGFKNIKSAYRTDDDHEWGLDLPVSLRYKDAFLTYDTGSANEIGYRFYQEEGMELALIGRMHWGYDSDDLDDEFDEMGDRDPDFHLGIKSTYKYEQYYFDYYVTKDVTGASGGMTAGVEGRVKLEFIPRKLVFIPSFGIKYLDSEYVDYFYGVKGSEARRGNINGGDEYRGAGSIVYTAGVTFQYIPIESIIIEWDTNFERHDSKIKRSPIVDELYSYNTGVSVIYKF